MYQCFTKDCILRGQPLDRLCRISDALSVLGASSFIHVAVGSWTRSKDGGASKRGSGASIAVKFTKLGSIQGGIVDLESQDISESSEHSEEDLETCLRSSRQKVANKAHAA